MSTVYISDQGHPRIIVRSRKHNPAFIRDLKDTLPRGSMEYSREGRRWFINRECRARVEAIAKRHFTHVRIQEAR